MKKLTNSMRTKWNSCHRAFKISCIDNIRPVCSSDALRFGTAFHSMLEIYWGKMVANKSEDTTEEIIQIANQYAIDNDDYYTAHSLLVLFEGYVAKNLEHDCNEFETIAVELEYDAPLVNPSTMGISRTYTLAGKVDGLVKSKKDGSIVILEHKTTSSDISPVSDYWKKLAIDGQVSGYYYGMQGLGYPATNCLYDVIRKPTIKVTKSIPVLDDEGYKIIRDSEGNRVYNKNGSPRQSEDIADGLVMEKRMETAEEWRKRLEQEIFSDLDKYFARMEIARSESDLQDYLYDMWSLSKELMDAENNGRYSRNPAGCQQFSGCEYWDVCTNCASLDDSTRFKKIETSSPELSNNNK